MYNKKQELWKEFAIKGSFSFFLLKVVYEQTLILPELLASPLSGSVNLTRL